MTRVEEIINAGVEYTESKRPMCIGGQSYSYEIFQMNRNHAFEEGAKWADKTMIDKACEWLEEQNKMCMCELEMILGSKFINDFKKAMEK